MDNRTGVNFHSRFSLLLIPSATGYADKYLSSATRRLVNMPIVTTTRFECYIGNIHLFA